MQRERIVSGGMNSKLKALKRVCVQVTLIKQSKIDNDRTTGL